MKGNNEDEKDSSDGKGMNYRGIVQAAMPLPCIYRDARCIDR